MAGSGPALENPKQLHRAKVEGLQVFAMNHKGRIWFKLSEDAGPYPHVLLRTQQGGDKVEQLVRSVGDGYKDVAIKLPGAIYALNGRRRLTLRIICMCVQGLSVFFPTVEKFAKSKRALYGLSLGCTEDRRLLKPQKDAGHRACKHGSRGFTSLAHCLERQPRSSSSCRAAYRSSFPRPVAPAPHCLSRAQ
jgi:hypothetical protein